MIYFWHHPFIRFIRIFQFLAALLIYLSGMFIPAGQITLDSPDKVMHLVGNALLFLSAWVAIYAKIKAHRIYLVLLPYAFCIEFLQGFTESRQVDLNDAFANIAGITVAYIIALTLEYFIEDKNSI